MPIIDNDKQTIGQVFNHRFPIHLSKHQRAYSWEEDEVASYCKDLLSVQKEYFFGGILSVKEIAQNAPGCIYRLVDGQQRLATFTLTIGQLKNAFEKLAKDAKKKGETVIEESANTIAEELERNHLTYKDTKNVPLTIESRLALSKIDKDFFKDLLVGRSTAPSSVSHGRLSLAWKKIHELLIKPILNDTTISNHDKLLKLREVKDNLLDKSVVINIITDNLDEAYQLFEVLNDRGKELAIGDFLRSTTLEMLEGNSKLQDDVGNFWDYILGKPDAEKFLKSYLSSHTANVTNNHLHRQFEKTFFSFTLPLTATNQIALADRVSDIRDKYDVYENINDGIWPYPTSAVRLTTWDKNRLYLLINELKHTLCIPFLLALYDLVDEKTFNDVVQVTEKAAFRYISASGLRANNLDAIYNKYIKQIKSTITFDINDYKSDLRNLISNYADDNVFEKALVNRLTYNKNNIKKIRYFLSTLEYYYNSYTKVPRPAELKPVKSTVHDVSNIDIEHIYPQTALTVDPTLEPLKNQLGNLSIWAPGENRAVHNDPFDKKQQTYKDSHIRLTRELNGIPAWNVSEVDKRLKTYQDLAKLIFKI
ncbi:DUF262 domain-containing protein [Bacillus thuringiensis]|uniref:DUF262 domain-containing protein n=1 Tax=Bacillus thuringiensis TaxID=1428 RepID=UPI000BFE3B1E|nr:DUF262 domain-containing protein [Bacillus thuringiensis]PGQ49748.1 hypothetical protein COA20_05345 [Bacillus thuringiensis]